MKSKICLYLILLLVLMYSCSEDDINNQDTALFKTAYVGNELNVDAGVYVRRGTTSNLEQPYFLYRDGVAMYTGEITESKLEAFRNAGEWGELFMSKNRYGVFTILNSKISIESWVATSGNDPFRTIEYKGSITSDTSFIITEVVNNERGETYARNYVYELERFYPKPDSTNT